MHLNFNAPERGRPVIREIVHNDTNVLTRARTAAGGIDEVATEDVATDVADADSEVVPTADAGVAEEKEKYVAVVEGEVQEHEVVAKSELLAEGAEEVIPVESEATVATVATDATSEDTPVADEDVIAKEAFAEAISEEPEAVEAAEAPVVTIEDVARETSPT